MVVEASESLACRRLHVVKPLESSLKTSATESMIDVPFSVPPPSASFSDESSLGRELQLPLTLTFHLAWASEGFL